jgi:hypothetical protein
VGGEKALTRGGLRRLLEAAHRGEVPWSAVPEEHRPADLVLPVLQPLAPLPAQHPPTLLPVQNPPTLLPVPEEVDQGIVAPVDTATTDQAVNDTVEQPRPAKYQHQATPTPSSPRGKRQEAPGPLGHEEWTMYPGREQLQRQQGQPKGAPLDRLSEKGALVVLELFDGIGTGLAIEAVLNPHSPVLICG